MTQEKLEPHSMGDHGTWQTRLMKSRVPHRGCAILDQMPAKLVPQTASHITVGSRSHHAVNPETQCSFRGLG